MKDRSCQQGNKLDENKKGSLYLKKERNYSDYRLIAKSCDRQWKTVAIMVNLVRINVDDKKILYMAPLHPERVRGETI